jgi:glutamate/tyrosine decarboxylase-like PLP-dependent enzyme
LEERDEIESFAFWDHGIELSRRFRALKVWIMLKYYGTQRVSAAIAEDLSLAEYMASQVKEADDLELLAPTDLSICCFRYVPISTKKQLDAAQDSVERDLINSELNRLNEKIMLSVQRGGRAYLSNAMLHGKFAMRACIINFRTTRADIDLTLETVREAAREIAMNDARL